MNSSTVSHGLRRWARPLIWAALCSASAVQAADIGYTVTSLGGDSWRYAYTLTNTAGGPAFDEFKVFFELSQVAAISSAGASGDWDVFVAQVDPDLPSSGYVDLLHLPGVIAPGSVTTGFSVIFTAAAAGLTPGAQSFDLIQSTPFTVVASGLTSAVPEPGTAALLLPGAALLAWVASRQARRQGARA